MERANGEATSAAAPEAAAGPQARYQPPAVEWEEEFEPVALSCEPGDPNPDCNPFRAPWETE